jgi:hypothetical protein
MNLTPGHPLVVAPFFHQVIDWSSRLLVSSGVEEEQGRFVPRPPWRAPTAAELAAVSADNAAAHHQDFEHCLCLFALPLHLQAAWWALVERAQATGTARLEGFDAFVREVAGFLAFKGLAVPDGARFDLVASQPGQRSIRYSAGGTRSEGLAFDLSPRTAWPLDQQRRQARLWGGINLGDEAVWVVLVNLAVGQIHDQLAGHCAGLPPAATLGELAERFLTYLPDYPPVRLRLEPGEGYRLPAGGILIDACTLDLDGPAALLLIGDRGEPETLLSARSTGVE